MAPAYLRAILRSTHLYYESKYPFEYQQNVVKTSYFNLSELVLEYMFSLKYNEICSYQINKICLNHSVTKCRDLKIVFCPSGCDWIEFFTPRKKNKEMVKTQIFSTEKKIHSAIVYIQNYCMSFFM